MSGKTEVSNQEEHRSPSDDEPLSRTDRFLIMSMLADEHRTRVSLSEDTTIGGATLSSIMELGPNELCNDLKLEDLFDSIHVVSLLNLQKIASDCFNEVQKNHKELHARDINLRFGFKAIDTFIQLYDRLERRWAKPNSILSGERVLVPLTPNTLVHGLTLKDKPNTPVDGVTLQELMEWCEVDLYLTLKPQTAVEAIFADLIVRTHKARRDCDEQADWWRHRPEVRELNLKYALKGIDSSDRLLARLESYRIKREKAETSGEKFLEVRHARKQDKARIYSNGNGKHP